LSALACSAPRSFDFSLCRRSPDDTNRLPLRIDQLNWAIAVADSFGNIFAYR
jgi:hypothetical protein